MKIKFIKLNIIAVGLICLAGIAGCRKGIDDFGNLNTNPNATKIPVTSALLTQVLSNFGSTSWDPSTSYGSYSVNAGLYCQYLSETQYTEASTYATPTTNWDAAYTGDLEDLQNIINYNSDPATAAVAAQFGSNKNQIAIARILKAYLFWQLTDQWGNLPYFTALKGGTGNNAYDSQDKIYPDLFKELRAAVAGFDNGLAVKGDILYSGNLASWKKLGNSIRMLMALRLSKIDPATGKTEFNAALSDPGGYIGTADDAAVISYPGGSYLNPFYKYYFITQRKDYAVSKTITDFLNSNSDPRVNAFGTTTIGFPSGLSRNHATAFNNSFPNWARVMSTSWNKPTSIVTVISPAHVTLARAEAAQIGWTTEVAATLYSDGIMQSWQQWGVYDATAFANYMTNPNINLATNPLQKIGTQRWLAFFPNGTQGWSEWRRTGYPVLTPAPDGLRPTIPRRMPYGPNEYNLNRANATSAGAAYTAGGEPNSQDARVWWDKP